ncbi:unnamed protein product [Angiostrongylus costaricensis]|uniref:RRM domain-containing protein n=1 Tax=Angiostrongylus costaricensis TaxID=334426 RepID=A0A0R3PWM3_ANGCS|nr:unnamed protein product [Angiostrongylus costaricensis]
MVVNPLTNIRNQNKLNERELKFGIAGDLGKSWHQSYKDSAWIYIGELPYDLTEGDIITVFSQYVDGLIPGHSVAQEFPR